MIEGIRAIGETIEPATSPATDAVAAAADRHVVITYHFPVEIEIRAADPPQGPDPLHSEALDWFARDLENY